MNDLDEEEIQALRDMIKREQAASLVWKWFKAILYVAVPLATLYSIYKSLGGQP